MGSCTNIVALLVHRQYFKQCTSSPQMDLDEVGDRMVDERVPIRVVGGEGGGNKASNYSVSPPNCPATIVVPPTIRRRS